MASLRPAWELPFVNVFKLAGVEAGKHVAKEGDVAMVLDREIGKKVLELRGSVPSRNFARIPKSNSKTLGLTGRFCYVQIKAHPGKKWAFHLDVQTADKFVHRISIGNMYNKRSAGVRGVQLQFDAPVERWVTLVVDFGTVLQPGTLHAFEQLKAAQFCANMRVRNLFTSDLKFSATNMPKDMGMVPASRAKEVDFCWMPEEPVDVKTEMESPVKKPISAPKATRVTMAKSPPKPQIHREGIENDDSTAKDTVSKTAPTDNSGLPDPFLQLERVNGYTGEFTRTMMWSPTSTEIVFTCNNIVVAMAADGSKQRFLMGHTNNVCTMAFSSDGRLLATGQEGRSALIRIWDFKSGVCLAILCGHSGGGLISLDISPDTKALAAVGLDVHAKQMIVLWDISKVGHVPGQAQAYELGRPPPLMLRHVTEYNIRCLRFSPYEDDRLMTCGKDSIRMYRLKNGTLRGISIRLVTDQEQCGAKPLPPGTSSFALAHNLFTDLAYEANYGLQTLDERHVFVATAAGAVFQVNYGRRQLECVYQLHTGAINAIQINEGFCVTASDDKFVRVWPVDFSDFFLEAEHETAVSAIGLSPDGLRIAVGCEGGSVGVMDVPTHQYDTLLRSHTGAITMIDTDPIRDQFVSTSEDGTIRVWDLKNFEQLFEFNAPGEKVTCAAYHPKRYEIAAGFDSGLIRVFDIASTSLIQEHQQHRAEVTQVVLSSDGDHMFSASSDGSVCVYDILQHYLPVKYLSTSSPGAKVLLACSPDGRLLAACAYEPGSLTATLLLFHAGNLEPYMRIETDVTTFTQISFDPAATELLGVTDDRRLERYDIVSGKKVGSITGLHRITTHSLDCHAASHVLATGGADGLVKVWPYKVGGSGRSTASKPYGEVLDALPDSSSVGSAVSSSSQGQSFVGHSGAVNYVRFSGHRLITGDSNDAIFIWRLPTVSVPPTSPVGVLADRSNLLLHASPPLPSSSRRMAWLLPDVPRPASSPPAPHQRADGNVAPAAVSSSAAGSPLRTSQASLSLRGSLDVGSALQASPIHKLPPRMMADAVVGFTGLGTHSNVVWSPSTAFFAYSCENTVVVEDLLTRKQRYLAAHSKRISTMALSSNGAILASAASGREVSGTADICLWNTDTGICTAVLSYHPSAVHAIDFTQDCAWLLSIGKHPESSVVVWDVATAKIAAVGRVHKASTAAVWRPNEGPNGPEFVTLGDGEALRWTLEPTHLAQRPIALPEELASAGLRSLACWGSHCYIGDDSGRVWRVELDAVGEPPIKCLTVPPVKVSSGGTPVTKIQAAEGRLVVGTADGQLVAYAHCGDGPDDWEPESRLELDGAVTSLAMDSTLQEGVAGSTGCTVWYYTVAPQATRVPLVYGHSRPVLSLATSPDNTALLASTSTDGLLRIWRIGSADAYVLMEFESPSACTRVVFADDSKLCIAGYEDGTLRAFDLDRVAVLWTVARHKCAVVALETSDSCGTVLSCGVDGSLAVTELQSSKMTVHSMEMMDTRGGGALGGLGLITDSHTVHDLAVSPRDHRMCALVWANRLVIFPTPWLQAQCGVVAEWRQPGSEPPASEGRKASCTFSPRDSHIVMFTTPASQGQIKMFDYRDSTITRTVDLPQPVMFLRPSLNGTLLGAGGTGNSVFLVDYSSGAWSELAGHSSAVAGIAFSSNSRRMFSSGGETIMVWRIAEPLH